jgi:membrane-associated phospholipid phosphatase
MLASSHTRRRLPQDPWWHIWGLSLGLCFAAMLMLARLDPDDFNRLDTWFEAAVRPLQTFGHVELFLVITVLGSTIGITTLAFGAAYFLRHNRFAQIQLFLVLLFSSLSMGIAKGFVERTRPDVLMWLDPLNTYSFPSGHATLSTAFFGFMAVQLYRRSHSRLARVLSFIIPALIIALVALSRIVLNFHYFTDVTAGILLGLFWVAVIFMLPRPPSVNRPFAKVRK